MTIREVIPSVATALTRLNENPENRKLSKLTVAVQTCSYDILSYAIVQDLDLLLELEYKYGTPKQYRPAIEDVLDYLQNVIIQLYAWLQSCIV